MSKIIHHINVKPGTLVASPRGQYTMITIMSQNKHRTIYFAFDNFTIERVPTDWFRDWLSECVELGHVNVYT